MYPLPRVFVALVVLTSPALVAARAKLAVLPTQVDESGRGLVPQLFEEYMLSAVQNEGQSAGEVDVIGQDDIVALMGFEHQKELVGCDDLTCIATIGGALGADHLVVVKVARIDDSWVVNAKLIDIARTHVVSRTTQVIDGNARDLLLAASQVMASLFKSVKFATPPPKAEPVLAAVNLAVPVTLRDLRLTVDPSKLAPGYFAGPARPVVVQGSFGAWMPLAMTAIEGKYVFSLSELIAAGAFEHATLLAPGTVVELALLVNGAPYVDAAGVQLSAGLTAAVSTPDGAWVAVPIGPSQRNNSTLTVP